MPYRLPCPSSWDLAACTSAPSSPPQTNIPVVPVPTTSPAPPSVVELADASSLYPGDMNWDAMVGAFSYGIGAKSWNSTYELNADVFVIHYLYLASVGEVNIDHSGPVDVHGHTLIPRDELERVIPNRFYVPDTYIRTSQYYDSETKSYCAVNIGPVATMTITEIIKTEDGAIVHFRKAPKNSDGAEVFDCAATIAISPTALSYRYQIVSFQTSRPVTEQTDNAPISSTGKDSFIPGTDIDCAKIAQAFTYQIGSQSLDNALAIDPDALVVHYIYLGGNPGSEVQIDCNGPVDDNYGNPLMPRDDLEKVITKYFDVPVEHIRQSQYYDPATESYQTGGIGSVAVVDVTEITTIETGAVIHTRNTIASSNYYDSWESDI